MDMYFDLLEIHFKYIAVRAQIHSLKCISEYIAILTKYILQNTFILKCIVKSFTVITKKWWEQKVASFTG